MTGSNRLAGTDSQPVTGKNLCRNSKIYSQDENKLFIKVTSNNIAIIYSHNADIWKLNTLHSYLQANKDSLWPLIFFWNSVDGSNRSITP
jgi:hypothetical protein